MIRVRCRSPLRGRADLPRARALAIALALTVPAAAHPAEVLMDDPAPAASDPSEPSVRPPLHAAYVRVRDTGFELEGRPYHFVGANFWQAMNLSSRGPGGDRAQLLRELDHLAALGVTNLRILAGSEGPDTEPLRVVPALQKAPGVYDADLLDGLDFLLAAMRVRGMKAVMVLGNEWHWSGGFGQYLVWVGAASGIPYPPPREGGDWDAYQAFVARFYGDADAVALYQRHVARMVMRFNPYTRTAYRDEPAIMSWELANEPRAITAQDAYLRWIESTSRLIKRLDPNHLVTVGSEGDTPWPSYTGTDYQATHAFGAIDYGTAHVWVQNWGWYDPARPDETYGPALASALGYVDAEVEKALALGKPIVFEEFGIARDGCSFDPTSAVTVRDRYFGDLFAHLYAYALADAVAGASFWAWAGESRPARPGAYWRPGDPLLGDPPHELQGWYSVYDRDASTLAVVRSWAARMRTIGCRSAFGICIAPR